MADIPFKRLPEAERLRREKSGQTIPIQETLALLFNKVNEKIAEGWGNGAKGKLAAGASQALKEAIAELSLPWVKIAAYGR